MAERHTILEELNFDRNAYSEDRPLGLWKASIDQTVYSKKGGKPAGIHLYVEHEDGQKIWLFVPWIMNLLYSAAKPLHAGDKIEVEIGIAKSGIFVVKQLRKLGQMKERLGETKS